MRRTSTKARPGRGSASDAPADRRAAGPAAPARVHRGRAGQVLPGVAGCLWSWLAINLGSWLTISLFFFALIVPPDTMKATG